LLDHFALLEDDRESWRVAHPLPDVPLLLVCGTIGACDDFDGIVEWREDNLPFLRRFLSHHHGVPGSRWLRILLNRIDPALSSEMFQSRAATLRPQAPALVAIDGKTSRASHDRRHGRAALHLVSTFATAGSWFWRRKRWRRAAASRPRSRFCWSGWRKRARSRARSCPSTRSPATGARRKPFSTQGPTIFWRSWPTSPA
jgi:hypothetical protein